MHRVLLATLLLYISTLFASEKIAIAVNDLAGKNIDTTTMAILSERVRSELIKSNEFTVVERGEMNMILEEIGFQQSGMCDESSCLVEMGQMLGVNHMVTGTIGKLTENFYTISIRMINVSNGTIEAAEDYDHRGDLTGLLSDGLSLVVGKLVYVLQNEQKVNDTKMLAQAEANKQRSLPAAFSQLGSAMSKTSTSTLAILPFGKGDLNAAAAQAAIDYFENQPKTTIIDRATMQKTMAAQGLTAASRPEKSRALQVATELSARYLLLGEGHTGSEGDAFLLRLIDVQSGNLLKATAAELNGAQQDTLIIDALGTTVEPTGALFRSLLLPGLGQAYAGNKPRAFIAAGLVGVSAGLTLYFGMDYTEKVDLVERYERKDPALLLDQDTPENWAARANAANSDMLTAQDRLNALLITTGTLWIANVVDATILGAKESKKRKQLYFGALPQSDGSLQLTAQLALQF